MISKGNNVSDIFDIIYSYYPKNYNFTSKSYMNSIEYRNYQTVLQDACRRIKLRDKCYSTICHVFMNNCIKQWESVEYPSLHFSVLLHENQAIMDDDIELLYALSGKRLDLDIYVSLISNYFYCYVIETNLVNKELIFSYHQNEKFISRSQKEFLDRKMDSIGFKRLERNVADIDVPNVETELLYKGEVKVFHCLFSDMEKHF